MKKKTIKLLFATYAVATIWTGCKKDKDLVPLPQPDGPIKIKVRGDCCSIKE